MNIYGSGKRTQGNQQRRNIQTSLKQRPEPYTTGNTPMKTLAQSFPYIPITQVHSECVKDE